MIVATSRYQAAEKVIASGLAPVGTTVGNPRFKLGYELAGRCGLVAPYGLFGKGHDAATFERLYLETRLERHGFEAIHARLAELAGDRPGVVLLCFEDVHAGEVCHRTMFASWWKAHTAEDVDEL